MFRWIGKSEDGKSVLLKKLEGCPIIKPSYATPDWIQTNTDLLRKGLVLDVETTGLNQTEDSIIEIGLRQFIFNRQTGEILALGKSYQGFQDPGQPLTPEITQLTGITDDMLLNQEIDWNSVDSLMTESGLIIAHNARFDRPFVDKKSSLSREKIWACTYKQIDWTQKGFNSPKLELLNIYHGFFTDSHRALNDAEALLYLLSLPDPKSSQPYLSELLQNARRPLVHVLAIGAPFDSKEQLKGKSYSWDSINRFWNKIIFKDEVPTELQWMEESVYFGPFSGQIRDIPLVDNFKS